MHSLHQIPLNVMKRHTLGGTMVDAPLDINAIIRVPIVFGILGRSICEMVTWLEWHVAFSSSFVLGIVGNYVHLYQEKHNMRHWVSA